MAYEELFTDLLKAEREVGCRLPDVYDLGWGSMEGRLVDGRTSVLPQVDLHCRRRAVGSL